MNDYELQQKICEALINYENETVENGKWCQLKFFFKKNGYAASITNMELIIPYHEKPPCVFINIPDNAEEMIKG